MLKKQIFIIIFSFIFTSGLISDEMFVGKWLGALEISGTKLRIQFNLRLDQHGKLAATMDSIDQGAKGIPVSSIKVNKQEITLISKAVSGSFVGTLSKDRKTIDGNWSQGGMTIPLKLEKTDKTPMLNRPQEPKPPFPYTEREVTYWNTSDNIRLAGTLSVPKGTGPFPAAILITGSGPQDRNETIFGHKPFLLISDYLTRRGISVLRVDDRGIGKSEGNLGDSTTVDLAGDVIAGLDFLKKQKEIDKGKIGLIGHSEGGIIAPIVASKRKDLAYIVLMAGTGINGEQIIIMQSELIMTANSVPESIKKAELKKLKQVLSIVKSAKSTADLKNRVSKIYKAEIDQEKKEKGSKETEKKLSAQLKSISSKWFKFFITLEPGDYLEKVNCPVLAINGEKDLQVPAKINLEMIKKYIKKGGNQNVSVKLFPNLNHLFQNANTGSPSEYASIEETMDESVLKTIGDWIIKTIK